MIIAPHTKVFKIAEQAVQDKEQTHIAFQDKHNAIRNEVSLMEEGIKQAAKLAKEGFEVFINRGRIAFLIEEAL